MKSYIAKVCVSLTKPVCIDQTVYIGYYINLCLDAKNIRDAKAFTGEYILDGAIEWEASKLIEADSKTVTKEILALKPFFSKKGVWYKSGRALFPKDE